ncbi:hypothetical protein SODALDRAFT_346983 [Sodiomyces alkalinus F11]|uniref:Ribosome biogenesis protein Urb1 n=1 Tax=Sodiomyces alkalinus (strain CBS 110278 / VKM F-3762 / F11) TaxID=1314773 RepID=A0A3N2Q4Y0_SODAK|nr:hypothetical protein SODALDRAFT_346983 [Sodiomyces alkalinus F11]ROT41833.1 hypothetical protein SODALDRAFT_346983 [Sodiomyces alkalinus F11]
MSKRQLRDVDGPNGGRKRQRLVHETPTFEEIHTGRQLRQLLSFDQDLKRARHGIQSLKVFLDKFASDTNENNQQRLALLREYLESERPRIASEDAVYLSDLMETWAFGSQVHNDSITAAVPAVLALLLQIISGSLDLLPDATGIAQTLLQERQLKLIARNLSASKGSGFIISPTLRLLREVASLDGGALARRLFRARDFTFASFARNLEVRNSTDSGPEDPTKPSVRTNAIKLFMTCLKFLPGDAKKELLMQKEVVSHLTFLLKEDPAYLIVDMLQTLKKHVLMDDEVAREAKFRAFGTKTLDRLAGLYSYRHDEEAEGRPSVKDTVHGFLIHACTTPGSGILYTGTGLYPKDAKGRDAITQDVKDSDDFALERVGWLDKYRDEVPVANFVLDEFIQKMRPWSSLRQSELIVAIFAAAPELAASYFLANSAFSFEPKLSMTWIGYATFIFDTVQLPIPRYFGNRSRYHRIPPPTWVLLGNILPAPLKQKDLVRSLSSDSNLISFFATRILILALQKLREALRMHREAADGAANKSIWEAAARRLVDEFCQRIPDMKEVTKCYKAIPEEENVLQREAASRLLLLYYEVIPQMALMANYDVSSSLLDALGRLENMREDQRDQQEQALGLMELENLLAIAGYSPGMRWFAKAEGLGTSPFVALLRVYAGVSQERSLARLREVLEFVSTQNQVVQSKNGPGLLFCVPREVGKKHGDMLWKFLDNCVNRCAISPLKYMDLMEEIIEAGGSPSRSQPRSPVSLVLVTMVEQAPFAAKDASAEQMEALVRILSSFLGYAKRSGENERVIDVLAERLNTLLHAPAKVKPRFKAALLDADADADADADDDDSSKSNDSGVKTTSSKADHHAAEQPTTKALGDGRLEAILQAPLHAEEDNSALSKWVTKSIDDLVDGEYIPALMRLLWSEHLSIRQEALTNLLKMAAKIKESSYEEKDQLWLLLSELAESSKGLVPSGPVASPLVAFALHSVDIIKNPLHCLYPKVNMYLTRSPVWPADKMPLAHDIFHGEPSPDDRYYTEVSWLLTYLLDGLRTRADLAVFHHKKWFEKVLGLAANPYMRTNLVTRVLRVVYRATEIEGGSTTLVTRFGIVSWLEAQEAVRMEQGGGSEEEARLLRALRRRVWETCDQGRVGRWSKGEISEESMRAA